MCLYSLLKAYVVHLQNIIGIQQKSRSDSRTAKPVCLCLKLVGLEFNGPIIVGTH